MPIYAYKCSACGFAKDVLQKMSDAPLTECPACHQATFAKQVTAAGFQLKGSGWYVTDFRNGGQGSGQGKSASSSASSSDGAGAGEKSAASAAPAAESAAAPAPAKSSAAA